MGKSLLIGNGLNRCLSNKYSAKEIISKLDKDSKLMKLDNFSLVFESIINKKNNFDEKEYFSRIAKELKELNKTQNDLYIEYKDLILSFDSILTTNYDFSIEYNLFDDKIVETKALGKNKGYVYSRKDCKMKIYHIHGDLNHKENLCLGFYGYQKYLRSSISNLKQNLSNYEKDKEALKKVKKSLPESLRTFIENDIYIIGLNLYDSELLLWNILTIRKELIRLGILIKPNKIFLFEPKEDDNQNSKDDAYKVYFNNYSIEFHQIKLESGNYKKYYSDVFDFLQNKLKMNNIHKK